MKQETKTKTRLERNDTFLFYLFSLIQNGNDGKKASNAEELEEVRTRCRYECAYNFPAMVLFVGAPGFKDVLYKTFSGLASDPCPLVRATIASGLHELAKILDAASFNLTKTQISDLFGDNDITVLEAMVGNMVHVIDALAR